MLARFLENMITLGWMGDKRFQITFGWWQRYIVAWVQFLSPLLQVLLYISSLQHMQEVIFSSFSTLKGVFKF